MTDVRHQTAGSALVVVPDSPLGRALCRALEPTGLLGIAATSARQALELAAAEKPRILVVDMELRDDPLALCSELRALEATRQVPILLITPSARLPERAIASGVNDFVTKPVDRELLATRVGLQLALSSQPTGSLALEQRLSRLESAQALAGIAYWEWDVTSDEVRLGPGAAGVLRLRDPLPSTLPMLVEACVHADDQEKFADGLRDVIHARPSAEGILHQHCALTVEPRYFKHFASVSHSGGAAGPLVTVTVRDVTDERRAEESARRIAFYDGLTGLANRRLFEKRLASALRRKSGSDSSVAVLFLDLDGFKQVNDRWGHANGDELLRAVAGRLAEAVSREAEGAGPRPHASVARFGGDEFAVLLVGIQGEQDAAEYATKIRARLGQPVEVEGVELRVSASIGIALHPRDGVNTEALMHAADAAMYAAKSDRSAPYRTYRADLDAVAARNRVVLEQLPGAVEREELSIAVQPKIELATGRILGTEALARWQSPSLGAVTPKEFIALAEERGLIEALGKWVLVAACREAASWAQISPDPPSIAVNISRVQLVTGVFQRIVFDALMESGLEPRRLELEITESLMIEGDEAIAPLRDLGAIGLTLALDDFGSGYSTLAALVRFPVQTIKLDRSLIREIDTNPDAARVVRAVIRMAHDLGRRVVAEGVDSDSQLNHLIEAECDEVQGFVVAKPLPAAEFRALLAAWNPEAIRRGWGEKK
jgi:diguanylate cyclase (GGDEF)-like protein